MSIEAPRIETLDAATTITLPRRRYRFAPLLLVGACVAEALFLVGLLWALGAFDDQPLDLVHMGIALACGCAALICVVGAALCLLLVLYLRGQTIITITDTAITAAEVGPAGKAFGETTLKREQIVGFTVARERNDIRLDAGDRWTWRTRATLLADRTKGPAEKLTTAYPPAILQLAASALRAACGLPQPPSNEPALRRDDFKERPQAPVSTTCRREELPDGVRVTIPAPGLIEGGGPGLLFGVAWTLIVTGIALLVWLFDPWETLRRPIGATLGVCLLYGLWSCLRGVSAAARRAVFTVAGEELRVETGGLFGTRIRRFQRDELADIRTRPATSGSMAYFTRELVVYRLGGGEVVFLPGRADEELDWLATVLRRQLRLPNGSSVSTD